MSAAFLAGIGRHLAALAAMAALAGWLPPAFALTPIKFQLDWRFDGPAALFLRAQARGYYQAAGLDVSIDAGNGSGGTVTRVAAGAYDMGFADMATLMAFHADNPEAPNKPVAVMVVYNRTPAAVLALKKSGINRPADLNGRKLGAPGFDAGRRAFPLFARANQLSGVQWTTMEPPQREAQLLRGEVDAITAFSFTALPNLEARGVRTADVVVLPYADFGVKLYGNVIIASPRLLKENPAAVKAFLAAFAKGAREVLARPDEAVEHVRARDAGIDVALERRRLRMAIERAVASPAARAEGFGGVQPGRLSLMAAQVSEVFGTRTPVDPAAVWTDAFLPSKAELNILPPVRK